MKKSQFLSFICVSLGLLVLGTMLFFPTDALAVVGSVKAGGLSMTAGMAMVGLVSLANLDGSSEGAPNPGGTRKLFIIHAKDVVGVWPKQADITAGEIAVGPTLVTGKAFAEYTFPDGTFDLGDALDGDPGFQSFKHMASFMLAGHNKTIVAEVLKHLNAGSIIIGQMNDDTYSVVGSSDNPIYVKSGFTSGKKGNDKRAYSFKGEQDGFMWGLTPLKPSVATALALLPLPV